MSEIPVIQYDPKHEKKTNYAWWTSEETDLPNDIFSVVQTIRDNQDFRSRNNLKFSKLYSNKDYTSFLTGALQDFTGNRVTFNVCRAVVDTAAAKIAKNKTQVLFLTNDGDWSEQTRAKKLTQYVHGVFIDQSVYEKGQMSFVDGGVMGTGILKFYKGEDRVCCERVFPEEIIVDDAEGRTGEPRQMHQRKLVNRSVLAAMFPNAKAEIESAQEYSFESNGTRKYVADLLEVLESWHLPSGPGVDDGRHSICIKEKTILDEEWKKNYFPFVVFRWSPPLLGWYGDSLISEVVGIQIEINIILMRIKQAQELIAVPRVFVENGSKIVSDHITNEIGGIIRYSGSQPVFNTAVAQTKEIYEYLEYLYNKAFLISGVSQLSASSKKPAGLDSGVALRQYQDIETERFALVGQRWQQVFIDAARIVVDLSRDLYKDLKKKSKDLEVKVAGKEFIKTIKWSECDLDDDRFTIEAFPISALPNSPEGRLAWTQELVQAGYIDKAFAISLLDFPDTKEFISLETAALNDVRKSIEMMLDEGKYIPPEPFTDLRLAIKMTHSAYLKAKTQNAPEDRLELLRTYVSDCIGLMNKINAEPSAAINQAQAQTEEPLGAPAPRPTSDLVPIQ